MKNKKVGFIVIGILVLIIILISAYFLFINNIVRNPYITFERHDTIRPAVEGWKPGYEKYYISKSGIVIKEEKVSGKGEEPKKYYFKKLSKEEVEELELYVVQQYRLESANMNSEIHNPVLETYNSHIYIKDKLDIYNFRIASYLISTYIEDNANGSLEEDKKIINELTETLKDIMKNNTIIENN